MNYSQNVLSIEESGIRKMFESTSNTDSINLGLGQPDFDTPQNIKNAAISAITSGKTGYTHNAGIDELRVAISNKLRYENGLDQYNSDNIMVTVGGSGALNVSIQSLINKGDRVVFSNPGFVSYKPLTTLSGGIPVPVSLKPDLHIDVNALTEQFSNKNTKLFILNNPSNPTGTVESPDTIRSIIESASD